MMRAPFEVTMLVEAHATNQDPSWRRVLTAAGIRDTRILQAMEKVRRADFLPASERAFEMEDRPLDIGHGQTTSQPSLIAIMLQELQMTRVCHVLEVGTGCGYQTALIAQLARAGLERRHHWTAGDGGGE